MGPLPAPSATVPHVKVCGVARPEDAVQAASLGARFIGLIFAEESPRRVTREQAAAVLEKVRASATEPPAAIGVFVDEPLEEIAALARELKLAAVQMHRWEGRGALEELLDRETAVLRAIRVKGPESQPTIDAAQALGPVLLDAFVEGRHGGTGKVFDHTLALPAIRNGHVLIAGGLNPGNIGAIARGFREQNAAPYAFDISSGLEAEPGIKDPEKMVRFFRELREAWG